jgi:hypothetical protein
MVSARLTEERYKALLEDAGNNNRSISEEVEHQLGERPIAAEILTIRQWFDQSTRDRIKQLENYTDELRRERNEAIQHLLDLQHIPTLPEEVRRALDQALARVFAKLLGTLAATEDGDTSSASGTVTGE